MILAPTPADLQDAIHDASVEAIQSYLTQGGSVKVVLPTGRTPMSELVHALLSAPDDDAGFYGGGAPPEKTLSPRQERLVHVGCTLIAAGANYQERAGKTSRSVAINAVVAAKLPRVHEQWWALHQRNLIMGSVGDIIAQKPSVEPVRRKM